MASVSSLFILVLLPLFLLYNFHKSSVVASDDKDLIQKTCQRTKYPDLCMSTIKDNQSSNSTDTKGLAEIVIQKAEASASATSMFLLDLQFKKGTSTLSQIELKFCANKYGNASKALQDSLKDLASNQYDFAGLKVRTANESLNKCDNVTKGLTHPLQLVEHLCDVAYGIINLLASQLEFT